MKREEVERKLELAETSLRQAAARLEATQQQLAEIEDQRAQILGESEIARRAMADFERLSEQSRNELAAIELEDARVALAEAVQARDQIVANAAAALDTAVGLLGEIDEHRNAVVQAHQRVRSLDQAAGQAAPEEPDVLHEPWERMASVVKTGLDEQLESASAHPRDPAPTGDAARADASGARPDQPAQGGPRHRPKSKKNHLPKG